MTVNLQIIVFLMVGFLGWFGYKDISQDAVYDFMLDLPLEALVQIPVSKS